MRQKHLSESTSASTESASTEPNLVTESTAEIPNIEIELYQAAVERLIQIVNNAENSEEVQSALSIWEIHKRQIELSRQEKNRNIRTNIASLITIAIGLFLLPNYSLLGPFFMIFGIAVLLDIPPKTIFELLKNIASWNSIDK